MASGKKLSVSYYSDKDILYLQILPQRPAKAEEREHGLLVRYDWEKLDEVVGFEILDFSMFVPHIGEPDALPELDMRFDVENSSLEDAALRDVLLWAYRRYVLDERVAGKKVEAV